jgi:hypothetical protein
VQSTRCAGPHFDSDAGFAVLVGDERHGRWRIASRERPNGTWRRYRSEMLIPETRHEMATGIVCVCDLMPVGTTHRAVIREVTGEAGEVNPTDRGAGCRSPGTASQRIEENPRQP